MNAATRSVLRALRTTTLKPTTRTITTLTTPLRPGLSFRPNTTSFVPSPTASTTMTADIVPRDAITSHPALAGAATQIRCGPRNTMNGHTRLVQKRRHGFLVRKRSRTGRKILLRRTVKGRRQVAH